MDMVERSVAVIARLPPSDCKSGSSAKLQRKAKMVALTNQISSIILLLALVIPYSPLWKPLSSFISLVEDLVTSGWLSSISPNFWILGGKHLTQTSKHLLQVPRPRYSIPSSNPPTVLFKAVRHYSSRRFRILKLFPGIAGAFGATIVYPIDMGKW